MARQVFLDCNKDSRTTRTPSTHTSLHMPSLSIERLRRRRSKEYLKAIGQLDTGGPVTAPNPKALHAAISAEFPEGPASWPLGWIAKCYLGPTFEVHTIDISGQIIQHFKRGEALPNGMERARSLAFTGHYAVIEVFSDCMVAIAEDGTTSVAMD